MSMIDDRPIPAWRLLIGLKWRLSLRGLQRNKLNTTGSAIALAILLCLFSFYGWALFHLISGFRDSDFGIFDGVLGGLYALWLIAPVIGYAQNESLDPSRLLTYPVSYRTILASSVLGGVLDQIVIIMAPILVALIAGASAGPAACIANLVVIVCFVLQTLATSRALVYALSGVLSSRRFRDVAVVVLPMVGMVFYLVQNAFVRRTDMHSLTGLFSGPFFTATSYLPGGWAARGLFAAQQGHPAEALLWCIPMALVFAAAVSVGGWVLRAVSRGEWDAAGKPSASAAREAPSTASRERPAGREAPLPAAIDAVYQKERRYFLRDPVYKALLVQAVYMLIVIAMPMVGMGERPGHSEGLLTLVPRLREALPFLATLVAPAALMQFINNMFGAEGPAISVLLTYPTPRRDILLGKTAAYATILLPLLLLIAIAICAVFDEMSLIGLAVAWVLAQVAVMLGVSAVLSPLLPQRIALRGATYQRMGCGMLFFHSLASLGGALLLLPSAGAVFLCLWLSSPLWSAVFVTAMLAYAGGLFWAGLAIGASLLDSRGPEIVERLSSTDG